MFLNGEIHVYYIYHRLLYVYHRLSGRRECNLNGIFLVKGNNILFKNCNDTLINVSYSTLNTQNYKMYWIKLVLNAVFRIFHSEIPVKQNEFICHRNWIEIDMINVDHAKTVIHQANILAQTGWIVLIHNKEIENGLIICDVLIWMCSPLFCSYRLTGFDFDRVSQSVEKNRVHLQSVTDRIKLAQARVQKIKGSKKATKVMRWFRHSAEEIRIESENELCVGHKLIIKT